MASPFVAEIRAVGFNFPPLGWAFCDGALLPISQNTALFSLLGTTYGGDGRTTFALPDLQGAAPVHVGLGPSGSEYFEGQTGGSPSVALLQTEIPLHAHTAQASADPAELQAPAPDRVLARSTPGFLYTTDAPNTQLDPQATTVTGSSFPHNNMPPVLSMNFVIAMQGIFPMRP
jgi:microcystin-dependent protein